MTSYYIRVILILLVFLNLWLSHTEALAKYNEDCSGVRLFLWTRDNANNPVEIIIGDSSSLQHFRPGQQSKIYIHEFFGAGFSKKVERMKDEYLKHSDLNYFSVDYKLISLLPFLLKSAEHVGLCVAEFIRFIPQPPELMHVIGFSLGNHAAGFIRLGLPKGSTLGRITALDPGRFLIKVTEDAVRLDPSHAIFVDTIFTGYAAFFLGLEEEKPLGHAQFFVNGGSSQPGCPGYLLGGALQYIGLLCSHYRAVSIFTESINSGRGFYGCNQQGYCTNMGEPVSHSARGKFYVWTRGKPPYAL